MKIEKLGKNHRKEVIGGLIVISVIGILAFNLTKAKYQRIEDIKLVEGNINYKPYDFKIMAMYKSDDGANYTEITNRMPEGYVINEEKSYCTLNNNKDNEVILKTEKGSHIINNLKKNNKCYLYFDKYQNVNTILGTLKVNYDKPDYSKKADTDQAIYAVYDEIYNDYSYYWRGAATTNYLKFAGYCWRIVRINGDGTLRIIYDGTTCHNNGEITTDNLALTNIRYNIPYNRSEYVGWTYTEGLQRPVNNNEGTPSNAKIKLEEWYNQNLSSYDSKIANGKYCNNREVINSSWSSQSENDFNYEGAEKVSNPNQNLTCSNDDIYKLKIGLITVEEAINAGVRHNNTSSYLHNGQYYWTMTPQKYHSKKTWVYVVDAGGFIGGPGVQDDRCGLRPVINLIPTISISGGNGTINNPYIIL